MKVRDLAKQLSKMPQDLEVYALEGSGALEVNGEMDITGCENVEDHHVTLYFEYFTPDSQEEDNTEQEQKGNTMKLTKGRINSYIKSKGSHCPFCGSKDIAADGRVEVDDYEGHQRINCDSCDATWQDIYHLVDVDVEIEE